MDGLRAAATFLVVCSHSTHLVALKAQSDPLALSWIAVILHTGTSVFLFVSGFLFAHLAGPGWNFRSHLLVKGQRVLLPYLVTSLVLIACLVPAEKLTPAFTLSVLINGTAGMSTWYIPFVTLIFLLAPVFLLIRDAPQAWRLSILASSFALALLVHRPPGNLDKLQALAYFAFFYLAGIETWLQLDRLRELAAKAWWLPALGAALLMSCLIQAAIFGFFPMYAPWFAPRPPDLWYAANVLLIATLCAFFLRFGRANRGLIRRLAEDSFGVFFLHNIVLELIRMQFGRFSPSGVYVLDLLITAALVFALSWALVLIIKRIFGKASRVLIGA